MKIAFFELSPADRPIFDRVFSDVEVAFFEEKLNETTAEKAKDADIVCVFAASILSKNVIDLLPNLKFIATRTTGFNHIDSEYTKSKGIEVSNVPGYGSHTVAEFTFALLLTLSRKIREADHDIKHNGDFSIPTEVQGFDLAGKTLGVIGTGKIGKNVIKIAKGFEMNIIAHDLYPDMAFANENRVSYKSLEEVISQSDVISLHAPSTKENFHLINEENISKMKKGVYIVNTARGDLIDTKALASALEEGIVAGAGLDVLEGEGGFKKGDVIPMLDMPNVVMTPHIAFDTIEAESRIMQTTIENIKGFLAGVPVNLVK